MTAPLPTPGSHMIASGLIGFPSDSLRVIVTRSEPGYVWVTTASLQDVGTKLVLNPSQVRPEEPETGMRHSTGLVTFG